MDRCNRRCRWQRQKTMDAAPLFGLVGRCWHGKRRLPGSPLAPKWNPVPPKNSNVCPSSPKLRHKSYALIRRWR